MVGTVHSGARWCNCVMTKKVKESENPLSLVLEQSCPWEDPPPTGAGETQDILQGGTSCLCSISL